MSKIQYYELLLKVWHMAGIKEFLKRLVHEKSVRPTVNRQSVDDARSTYQLTLGKVMIRWLHHIPMTTDNTTTTYRSCLLSQHLKIHSSAMIGMPKLTAVWGKQTSEMTLSTGGSSTGNCTYLVFIALVSIGNQMSDTASHLLTHWSAHVVNEVHKPSDLGFDSECSQADDMVF